MRPLNATDLAFISAERREMPMHVGSLLLFNTPEDAPPDYLRGLYETALAEQEFRYPLNQKLTFPASRLGVPHWAEDELLDPGYHLRHSALPAPGRYRELFVLVSRLHGTLLDRSRPLWETHVIEGLQSGQFAMYVKVHHGLIDGVGAMRVLQSSLSEDPSERGMPFAWSADAAPRRRTLRPAAAEVSGASGASGAGLVTIAEAAAEQLKMIPHVGKAMLKAALSVRDPQDGRQALPFEAPKSALNTHVTGARRFVAQSYSLERIHKLSKRYGATVNDIVLAMCGSALRRYLESFHGGAPGRPLVAAVPVSVKPRDADAFGNALAAVLVNLGTHIADPVKRFEVIRASMADGKAGLRELSYHEAMVFTGLFAGPAMAPALLGLGATLPAVNVVISNVPGPRVPKYWNGARLQGMYPASIVFHGMALNITLVSTTGNLDFGIVACRRALPRVQRLIDFLELGLVELEEGVG